LLDLVTPRTRLAECVYDFLNVASGPKRLFSNFMLAAMARRTKGNSAVV
jgi:hypothetical protein